MLAVREATSKDANRFRDLLGQLGYDAEPSEVTTRLALATTNGGAVLVVTDNGASIGFASYQIVYFFEDGAPRCRLTAIAVDSSARNRGAGRALIDAIEERARAAGCSALEATSAYRAARQAAHQFYPAVGFADGAAHNAFYTKDITPDP
jgi:GNAT superfamily N-acetyltransferase